MHAVEARSGSRARPRDGALPEPLDGGAPSAASGADAGIPKGNHVPQWVVKYVPITPVIPR
jgi:hypothetical protein